MDGENTCWRRDSSEIPIPFTMKKRIEKGWLVKFENGTYLANNYKNNSWILTTTQDWLEAKCYNRLYDAQYRAKNLNRELARSLSSSELYISNASVRERGFINQIKKCGPAMGISRLDVIDTYLLALNEAPSPYKTGMDVDKFLADYASWWERYVKERRIK